MKTLLSLFDHSGCWSGPFREAGWNVIEVDVQNWIPLDVLEAEGAGDALELYGSVDGIIAAPPCTDFACSGAWTWADKDRDGRTTASVELVIQTLRLIDLYTPTDPDYFDEGGTWFWALENPVGRLPKLVPQLGDPALTFDPCEFGGWLQPRERTHALAPCRDAYTKRTHIWGSFAMPERRPVQPKRVSGGKQWTQALGGKSPRTKNLRSMTPAGFARAFAAANCN
jgi:hypothetical protein